MKLREKLLTNYRMRVLLREGETLTNYTTRAGGFTPYFAYIIGDYQDDFYLYFNVEPFSAAYYNEIFNKMACYFANDAILYIKFHLERYADKRAFLDFLFYELQHRCNQLQQPSLFFKNARKRKWSIFQMCLSWITKEIGEIQAQNKQSIYNHFLRNDIKMILNNHLTENGIANIAQNDIAGLREILNKEVDRIVSRIEEKTTGVLENMQQDFLTSSIETPHPRSMELFILMMLVLKDYQVDKNYLFTGFAEVDIAKILRLHFDYFKRKDTELDTIRKKYINPLSVKYRSDAFNKHSAELDTIIKKFLS